MADITTVATFPPGFFLENIATLPDDTLLVTVANRHEIYCLPPSPRVNEARRAFVLDQFPNDQWAFGLTIMPHQPHIAYLLTTDFTSQGSCTHYLRLLDLSNVASGCRTSVLMQFPSGAKGLNGLTALSDSVLLAADSFAGCIWRIDLQRDGNGRPVSGTASEWLRDPTFDGELVLPDFQPGVNGLKYSHKTGTLCFSSTQQRLFGKVSVDGKTLQPDGPVVILAKGAQGDDLLIDEDCAGGPVAYLATHRDNTILRIPVGEDPIYPYDVTAGDVEVVAAGSVCDPVVLGPTAGAWEWGGCGRTAYFTCDGGLKEPIPGEVARYARIVRVELEQ